MAEQRPLVVVPDPAGVSTPDDLATALDKLRQRQDLSFAELEEWRRGWTPRGSCLIPLLTT